MSFSFPASIVVHALDVLIGQLLHLGLPVLRHVLADLVLLLVGLDLLHAVAPHRTHRDPRALGVFMRRLRQLGATLRGELRDRHAHQLPIGGRIQPEPGIADRLLDRADQAAVPHLHGEHARLRRTHGADLIERRVRPVGRHLHRFEQAGMRAPGAQSGELALERVQRAIHAACQVLLQLVEIGLCHGGLPDVSRTYAREDLIAVR